MHITKFTNHNLYKKPGCFGHGLMADLRAHNTIAAASLVISMRDESITGQFCLSYASELGMS